ncbi:MAG TPA: hypothetical protein ENI34_10260 [candidate division WOR-3 bacterium]|uniref:Uncharacterized protein n=1 Tax=candidate division WOR-3 bacterium TaxID=2052148 RepID=A0A9C9EP35_UNCW3|nr:hypothetical protein [candidate division WOR-3 bacterium]
MNRSFLYVRDKETGKIVDKIEIEKTAFTAGSEATERLSEIIGILKGRLREKYPAERYDITGPEPQELEGPALHPFKMEAKGHLLFFTNLGGVILGAVLLFLLLLLRHIYVFILFIIGVLGIILYMAVDYIIWWKKGIRAVEVDENGVVLYRGKHRRPVKLDFEQITGIDFFTKLNRRVITILTGGKALKVIPGITLFSGPRIRITDDTFGDDEFTVFIERLKQFKKKQAEGFNS